MAITHRPAQKSSVSKKQVMSNVPKTLPIVEDSSVGSYFSEYLVVRAIEENSDFYAEVKEHVVTDSKDFIRLSPYLYEGDKKVYYEEVFLNLNKVSVPSTAAGQFLTLFAKARYIDDILNRIVGIEVKLSKSNTTGTVFKNVVRVYETDEDELIFDGKHMAKKVTKTRRRAIDEIVYAEEDETEVIEEEDEMDSKTPSVSKFSDDVFDEEDIDDLDEEE